MCNITVVQHAADLLEKLRRIKLNIWCISDTKEFGAFDDLLTTAVNADLAELKKIFEALNTRLGEYWASHHSTMNSPHWTPHWSPQWTPGGLEPSMNSYLNPNLHQDVGMNTQELAVTVPKPVHVRKGMFSELHSKVSEAGIPVTATHFDLQREMLWMGNYTGHVKSFLGPTMARYSSFQVHATDAIRHMQSLDTGVLFLSKSNLRCYTRGGLVMFDYRMEEGADMHSLLMTDNMLLMGGLQNYVVEVDLNTLQETQKFTVEAPGVTIMRQTNRFFFFGHPSGKMTLRDLRTFRTHGFDTFPGGLSDFDVHGNLLAVSGFSSRGLNERFVMVYDLRMTRAATPLWMHVDPVFVRFIPTYTSRLAIISQTGEGQFCEPTGLANVADIFHVNTNSQFLTSFEVSSSKRALAFGDSGGCVRLWSDTRDVMFNVYSREPCIVDALPQLAWNPNLQPCSPIPTVQATPSSRWAPGMEPEIPQTIETVGFNSYVENPYACPCNQIPANKEGTPGYYNHVPESPTESDEEPLLHTVPEKYRKVTIKYSKRGREDFDFKHYNRTLFAGLEPQIPNAYCNCMIQVLYFLEPVRCLVQNHLCHKEFCLACELGFLFHMLDLSQGDPCQASNFLRALRNIPEAKEMGLILSNCEETTGTVELGRLIQRWNHFILYQLFQETQEQEDPQAYRTTRSSSLGSSGNSVITELFCSEVENRSLCLCGIETVHSSLMSLFNMHYPDSQGKRIREYDFAEILKKSICLQQRSHTWCGNCDKYQPTVQTRNIRRLPDVLVINCEVNSSKEAEFWKVQAEYTFNKFMQKTDQDQHHVWIPATLKMSLSKSQRLEISSWPEGEELSAAEEAEGASLYDLVVTVPHILDAGTGGNLVAHIKVGETYHQRKEGVSRQQWYLFNDFLIEPIEKTEAAQFDVSWKVPAILCYAKRNYHTKYDLRSECQHNQCEVKSDLYRTQKQSKTDATFIPLTVSEMLQAGDLVGLDAEFVKLSEEEAVLHSDGTKSTITPSQMSVARITCVRGQGPNEGVPFIDDYISTQEQVVDYLTKYSGIKPGDLDATVSSKHVTTLKSTYLKLRFLIDAGVRFVGHGLQNDFRVINLVVPKDQVIDTVHLFRLPYKRMISLKFLAWYFLGLNIQGETHDSTEDSCTALKLYRKYLELYQEGGNHYVMKVLYEVYDKGFQLNWKVPVSDMR
ncbi:PAN2-PAN3 deadenylation complex catalytic subunit PAN2-like [Pelmatolapia mariae]|uniref:PAN2-PAN3 deadenylation complex catalytic subunit PAN2-like n=1 Tax=Pelmatolapia mariae TaxID=158779 RepID=UPI002FE6317C